jgi:NAD(P)-dependent dehydrogenase (short-subunit alcohol dehydrogenase family)
MSTAGKTILVTGASRGIGRALTGHRVGTRAAVGPGRQAVHAADRRRGQDGTVRTLLQDQPALAEGLPLISTQNASATGTDLDGYFSEGHGVSTFARQDEAIYHCEYHSQ